MAKKKSTPSASSNRASESATTRVRLQRALASAGFGSRRHCEELIAEGRVMVDGVIADQLGTTVDLSVQKVFVDGTPLKPRKLIYYALNKPVGVVTTSVDPEGRPRVIDLVPPDERVFAVGRLDRNSEGLILLTNDGELAQKLAHPRFEIKKVYRVVVAGRVETETLKQMERGIHIAEGLVRVEGAKLLKARGRATELEIVLREGKNREIRRILARLGHKVQQLKRIAIGPLRLGEMPVGAYRQLSYEELKKLRAVVEPGAGEPGSTSESGTGGKRDAAPERRAKTGLRKRPGGPAKAMGRGTARPVRGGEERSQSRKTAGAANRERGADRPSRSSGPERPARRKSAGLLDLSGGKSASIGTVIGADESAEDRIVKPRRKLARGGSEREASSGGKERGAKRTTKKRRFSDEDRERDGDTRAAKRSFGKRSTSVKRSLGSRGVGGRESGADDGGSGKGGASRSGPGGSRRPGKPKRSR